MKKIVLKGEFKGFTIIGNRIYTPSNDFIHKNEVVNMWLFRQIRDVNNESIRRYLKYLEDFNLSC